MASRAKAIICLVPGLGGWLVALWLGGRLPGGPLGLIGCIFQGLGAVDEKIHGFGVPFGAEFDGFWAPKT